MELSQNFVSFAIHFVEHDIIINLIGSIFDDFQPELKVLVEKGTWTMLVQSYGVNRDVKYQNIENIGLSKNISDIRH